MRKFLAVVLFSVLVLGVCVPSFALTNQEWAEIIGTGVGLVAGVILPSIKDNSGQPLVKDATQFQVAFYATMSGNLLGRVVGVFLPDGGIDGRIAPAEPPLEEDPTVFILYNETGFWRIEVGINAEPRKLDKDSGFPVIEEKEEVEARAETKTEVEAETKTRIKIGAGAGAGIQFSLPPGKAKWVSLSPDVEQHIIKAHAYLHTKQGWRQVFKWETAERVYLLGRGKTIRYRIDQ